MRSKEHVSTTEETEVTRKGCECGHKTCDEDDDTDAYILRQDVKDERAGMEKIVFVDQISQLDVIKNETVQLAVWRQNSVPKFEAAFQNPSIDPLSLPTFDDLVTPHDAYQRMMSYLCPPYNLRSKSKKALADDEIEELLREIDQLVKIFAKISESDFVYVKLEVKEDDGCRYWHQDCVNFRLVKTYRGPCTEWVPPAFSKATLKCFKVDSDHAQSLSHRDVAIFKGKGESPEDDDDDNLLNHNGIVHRSPRWRGDSRLVLVLDIPQEGWHF